MVSFVEVVMNNLINVELILNFIKTKNLSKTKFCKICKISYSTFKKIMGNDDKFGAIALFKIARVLGVNICELLK